MMRFRVFYAVVLAIVLGVGACAPSTGAVWGPAPDPSHMASDSTKAKKGNEFQSLMVAALLVLVLIPVLAKGDQ